MQTTVMVAELERLTKQVRIRQLERAAWEDAYVRLTETVEAAHAGRTPRVALWELQAAAEKASKQLAQARLNEESAVAAYLKATAI